jgi:hypothetical protein
MTPPTPPAQQDTQILDDLIVWSKKHNEYDGPSIRRFIESRRTRPHTPPAQQDEWDTEDIRNYEKYCEDHPLSDNDRKSGYI